MAAAEARLLVSYHAHHPVPGLSPPTDGAVQMHVPCVQGVLKLLHDRGICARVATQHLAAEEAPESYKAR